MIAKIFKMVWYVSVFIYMVVLMYVYAGLPEEVEVMQAGNMYMLLGREAFFYMFLALAALSNFLVFSYYNIRKKQDEDALLSWTLGLGIVLNGFYIFSLNFISLYNSAEKINYKFSGYMLYAGLYLLVIWVFAWPIYSLFRKFLSKA
ncbi:MAG TPA: hypothetical protein PKC24_08325 [Cyclobacteriaceae bacterium]|nr:hypothetical protein [Cyclobacteriaceae bacterium]